MSALTGKLGEAIAANCPPEVGFALLIFTPRDGCDVLTYGSNGNRRELMPALRKLLERLEREH